MAYDPTPIDKGFASTAKMGAEGSMGRQGAYQPRMTDPESGQKLQKGKPVPAASPARVRNPIVGEDSPFAYMQKGKPVPGPSGSTPTGDFLKAAGQTVADTFFNPKNGAARNRGAKGR